MNLLVNLVDAYDAYDADEQNKRYANDVTDGIACLEILEICKQHLSNIRQHR